MITVDFSREVRSSCCSVVVTIRNVTTSVTTRVSVSMEQEKFKQLFKWFEQFRSYVARRTILNSFRPVNGVA